LVIIIIIIIITIKGTLQEHLHIFVINVSPIYAQIEKLFRLNLYRKSYLCGVMCKDMVEPDRPQITVS